jgi:hypothetical protein
MEIVILKLDECMEGQTYLENIEDYLAVIEGFKS